MMSTVAKRSPITTDEHTPKTGLHNADREKIGAGLASVLADTYTLTVKTHVYHWNVVGPLFLPFHELTDEQYKNLFEAADSLAERIRALGRPAPLSFAELIPKATITEETALRTAEDMIGRLVKDHERIAAKMRDIATLADKADDLVTTDLLTERLAFHEKAIWMLGAMIAQPSR